MKDIPGYEGLYAVTKDGKIWSYAKPCSSKEGMWLKQYLFSNKRDRDKPHDQYTIHLYKEDTCKNYQVHRLVAITYIPNLENLPQINHKDGDSLNNQVLNLEWVTQEQNMQHGISMGLIDAHSGQQDVTRSMNGRKTGAINGMKSRRMFTMSEAICIRIIHKTTEKSFRAIARAYNCSGNTIIKICNYKSYLMEAT